jgi:hypothetical protein
MLQRTATTAPPEIHQPLQQFHPACGALNSRGYTGIHPIARATEGFPEALALQLVLNSNGLLHFAYRLLASYAGHDCLPRDSK